MENLERKEGREERRGMEEENQSSPVTLNVQTEPIIASIFGATGFGWKLVESSRLRFRRPAPNLYKRQHTS